ncbi:T. brucei spp.-specific protein [Trypanosoma brucei gambiense DAL972]|uniref:T. brucei spp.-specific protein n=1 Tax=Trypanosoma brucei gambiense (strain MHOM/CI/86/DAL972) TaxID=679716 RepID=D0A1C6_TRYB9|nr:LOW QUALITY PROTEIN: T. brucei spp.-specific protein [Trypanosoma brucei gambiense DAL972]CBH15068.1 T. brucei spp.-specific protein [Trypanosoma brucei gambiense DAL972]|eukprot:XP_011777334.1 LOW QUALITY PROTEIN: T. brucei spp.-specific protein [Trypanosoma brucei gambiense DAL972]
MRCGKICSLVYVNFLCNKPLSFDFFLCVTYTSCAFFCRFYRIPHKIGYFTIATFRFHWEKQWFSAMWREKWDMCCEGISTLWTVGGRLRNVYNSSKSEAERRRDVWSTLLCTATFAMTAVAFAAIDAHGGVPPVVWNVLGGAKRLLRR